MNGPDPPDNNAKSQEQDFFDCYASFSRILRAWLVAYGIGAPAFIATQDFFKERITDPAMAALIILLFLIGVGLQGISALLYKFTMLILYHGEADAAKHKVCKTWYHKRADCISESILIEFALDAGSILAFCAATAIVLWLMMVS